MIVEAGYDGPALAAAERFGLTVLRLSVPEGAAAGEFDLSGDGDTATVDKSHPGPDDIALILHTTFIDITANPSYRFFAQELSQSLEPQNVLVVLGVR